MNDALEQLRKLTPELPAVPKLGDLIMALGGDQEKSFHSYEVPGGMYESYALFSSSEISVARAFITKGARFPAHSHDETEYGLIYTGSVKVTSGKKVRVLNAGDCIVHRPGVAHSATALEDTRFIAVTVPFSKDLPQK